MPSVEYHSCINIKVSKHTPMNAVADSCIAEYVTLGVSVTPGVSDDSILKSCGI